MEPTPRSNQKLVQLHEEDKGQPRVPEMINLDFMEVSVTLLSSSINSFHH